MSPTCKKGGCYMFAPATRERAACMSACHLEQKPKKATAAGILLALATATAGAGGKS